LQELPQSIDCARHAAQGMGKELWYEHYQVRVARVQRAFWGPEEHSLAGLRAKDKPPLAA